MARPLDPRSRAQACRLTGMHEATVRKMERAGLLPPIDSWTVIDLVWAKALTSPGVSTNRLPPRPEVMSDQDVLVVPLSGPEIGTIHASMLQAIGAVDALRAVPVAVLAIGAWYADLREDWS